MSESIRKASLENVSKLFTEEVLFEIVQKSTKSANVSIVSYKVSYATAPGEGYLGIIYRISVQIIIENDTKEISFIAKGMPVNLARRKTWKMPRFFKNEILFYDHILPALLQFESKKRGHSKKSLLAVPECLMCHCDGENDYIVLSDLGLEGFKNSERTTNLNIENCKIALKSLGYLHGISLSFKNQEPKIFNKLIENMIEAYYHIDHETWFANFLKNQQKVAIDAITKVYPNSIYEKKLRGLANEHQYKLMCELVKPNEPYASICHGDAWGPNFMYRDNKEGDPVDVKMIDFQLVRYASPVLDPMYLIFSVTTKEQRENGGFESLLGVFHSALSEAIIETGGNPEEIFPFNAMMDEIQKYGKYGLAMGLESIPISLMESDEVLDLDAMPGDEALPLENYWKVSFISTEEGRLRLADLIKFTVDRGFI